MKIKPYFVVLLTAICFSCNQNPKVTDNADDTSKVKNATYYVAQKKDSLTSDKTDSVRLKSDFVIKTRYRFGTGKFKTMHYLEIFHRGKSVFKDTTDTATNYRLKPIPVLKELNPGIFELSIPFDSGFNKNISAIFKINNDKVREKNITSSASK